MEIASETLLGLYRTMLTIRLFEQRVAREFRTGEIPGFVHMYVGEEAVAAGVCANLGDDDYITSTHRGHGHCIAKGCDLRPDDGGDLRARGRPLPRARRLDAHRGLLAGDARSERDRRRRHRARDRRGPRVERARQRAGCGRVLRRRRRQPGRAPREPQPRCDLEAARDLRLREQRLRRVDAVGLRDERRRHRLPRLGVRDPRASSPTAPTSSTCSRRRARRRSSAPVGRRGADAARGQDLPVHGPFRRRSRALPRRRRAPTLRERDAIRALHEHLVDRRTRDRRRRSRRCSAEIEAAISASVEFATREPVPRPGRARAVRLSRAARSWRGWPDGCHDGAHAVDGRRRRRGDATGDGGGSRRCS